MATDKAPGKGKSAGLDNIPAEQDQAEGEHLLADSS